MERLGNAEIFGKPDKKERIRNALIDNGCCGFNFMQLWNACEKEKIYGSGDFEELAKSKNFETLTDLVIYSHEYCPDWLFLIDTGYGFESYDYIEDVPFYDENKMIEDAIEQNNDGGLDYIREILDEED